MRRRESTQMASKVLIVEDNSVIARLWSGKLQKAGYETRIAADGRTARNEMQRWRPDAVLLDMVLPETDGLSLCREWRADEASKGVRIFFVSAVNSERDVHAAKEAGANGYLHKSPATAARIVNVLQKSLQMIPA